MRSRSRPEAVEEGHDGLHDLLGLFDQEQEVSLGQTHRRDRLPQLLFEHRTVLKRRRLVARPGNTRYRVWLGGANFSLLIPSPDRRDRPGSIQRCLLGPIDPQDQIERALGRRQPVGSRLGVLWLITLDGDR